MRFSLFLVACTLLSSTVALPGGRKPGTNDGVSKGGKGKEKAEAPPAQPGDVVLVNSHDFIDGKINGHGSSERRTHPAVVVQHDEQNHIVHVAPIGHEHPGDVPTIPAAPLGIPDNNGVGHIVVGPPKQIPHDKVKPLGEPRKGSAPLPERLEDDHFKTLQTHITANTPPAAPEEPSTKDKGKKKSKEKRSFDRRRLEARRRPNW